MAQTNINDVQAQVQQFWAPMFMKELREVLLLGSLVNRDYQGDLKAQGDTVKVSQINAPAGQLLTVGTDADTFQTEKLDTVQVEVKADKRAVAAFEFSDLVQIQSQIGAQDSEIRRSLMFSVMKKLNDELYTKIAPSTSDPDHEIGSVTDFDAAQVTALRLLASKAKWNREKPWWLIVDPSYMKDMLDDQTLVSADFVGDRPVVGGSIIQQRFGWNIVEDNSRPTDFALAFHPDWLYLVMQREPTFEISNLHSNKQFGFVISVDLIFGSKLGIDGDVKHIRVVAT